VDKHGFPETVEEYIRLEGYRDLGHNHAFRFHSWRPDRALNPQYAGVADVGYFGCTVVHYKPDGSLCMGGIQFDTPGVRAVNAASKAHCLKVGIPYVGDPPHWQLISLHPLHVEPSLLCKMDKCGDHGFIRGGRWVPA
jgi:hypothetical protein